MKKIIMTIVSIVSITSMANVFSSEERTKLLDKKSYKKGTFELINKDKHMQVGRFWAFISLKNGDEMIINEKKLDFGDEVKATINISLPTELTLYERVDDTSVMEQYGYGTKLVEVGSYTFPTGKDIRVVFKRPGGLKPQKSLKGLLSKNKNVTQDDITFTPKKEKTVPFTREEARHLVWK